MRCCAEAELSRCVNESRQSPTVVIDTAGQAGKRTGAGASDAVVRETARVPSTARTAVKSTAYTAAWLRQPGKPATMSAAQAPATGREHTDAGGGFTDAIRGIALDCPRVAGCRRRTSTREMRDAPTQVVPSHTVSSSLHPPPAQHDSPGPPQSAHPCRDEHRGLADAGATVVHCCEAGTACSMQGSWLELAQVGAEHTVAGVNLTKEVRSAAHVACAAGLPAPAASCISEAV